MRRRRGLTILAWLGAVAAAGVASGADPQQDGIAAERRAVAYLSREVPQWPQRNQCFSCHNNGDAARALYTARARSFAVPDEALAETTDWLLRPAAWNEAKGNPGFSDLKLARIQFAGALAEAVRAGAIREQDALAAAADGLLADQERDGSWDVDVPGVIGSPATYGDALGTYMARRTLQTAGALDTSAAARFGEAMARADGWFLTAKSAATVDVAAVALGLGDRVAEAPADSGDALNAARGKLAETLARLVASPGSDGGWGPYPKSPSEVFDTAVALLALRAGRDAGVGDAQATARVVERGRAYLIGAQLPGGGWPGTTRPSGFQSYAQHISTSGWAVLALLETEDFARP
jgi:hypothetical protein